jgi:hypothetical protein
MNEWSFFNWPCRHTNCRYVKSWSFENRSSEKSKPNNRFLKGVNMVHNPMGIRNSIIVKQVIQSAEMRNKIHTIRESQKSPTDRMSVSQSHFGTEKSKNK